MAIYLPESTQKFKTPDELAALMRDAGFKNVQYQRFMFGTMAVHCPVSTGPERSQTIIVRESALAGWIRG